MSEPAAPKHPSQQDMIQLLRRGSQSSLPLCCHAANTHPPPTPCRAFQAAGVSRERSKHTCAHGTSGLPRAEKQVKAGNANAARGLTWASATGLKAGRGEGEAGRCQRRVLRERRSRRSEVGRGPPVSLWHNRRPLSSEQSELGEREAKERQPHPTGHHMGLAPGSFLGDIFSRLYPRGLGEE